MKEKKSKKREKQLKLRKRYKRRIKRHQENKHYDLDSLRIAFSGYEKLNLLCKISGLNLLPQNQGRTIRLEIAQRMACSAKSGHNQINNLKLASILSKYLPNNSFYAQQEDPVDNLFTENLIFYGGNYVLYPGITESGIYILQTILNAIFRTNNNLPKIYKDLVYSTSLLLLKISNNISKRLNHKRNMEPSDSLEKTLHVPSNKILNKLARACIFTNKEITELTKRFDLDIKYLTSFLISFSENKLRQGSWRDNPIYAKPFCKIEGNIVLLQPSCLACALRHFIIVKAKEYDLSDELYRCLRNTKRKTIERNLTHAGYSYFDFQLPEPFEFISVVDEMLYKFDNNKICYVQIITDDLIGYDHEDVFGHRVINNLGEKLQKRQKDINQKLLNDPHLGCENILNLVVISSIGRSLVLGFNKSIENTLLLAIFDEEIDIAIKSGDFDTLTFWKYARTYDRFLDKHPKSFPLNSYLDIYNLYLKHGNSLTLSDSNFNIFVLDVGSGNELRIKARKSVDTHASKIFNMLTTVHKRYSEGNIPIYFSEDFPLSYRLIEGYDIPIWVMPQSNSNTKTLPFHESFSEMFAYWIWQLTPSLKSCINNLPLESLIIHFDFDNIEKWSDYNFYNNSDEDLTYKISENFIYLNIPIKYKSTLSESDNRGEKDILIKLIEAITLVSKDLNIKEPFYDVDIENMVNSYAYNKFKKMILLHTCPRASLNPENLPKTRLLQKNDEDDQLEGLANLLIKNKLPIGSIDSKTNKLEVLREVVEIFHKRLKDELLNFNYKDLLPILISYQESIWFERARKYLNWPTLLECFSQEKDYLEKEIERFVQMNATSIGIRFLIEFISAELPEGRKKISLDDYDRLVAIAYEFVNWATHHDQLESDLFESELSILPNGRIGRNREYMGQFKNVFISKKIQEKIDISYETFADIFRKENYSSRKTDSKLDNALLDEFGMRWDDICDFHNTLTNVGFQKKVPCVTMPYNEFIKELTAHLRWSENKIKLAIDNFSLTQRKKWEEPTEGYDFYQDIAPWRYKRKLSFILRCLVHIKQSKRESLFYWGPRHAEESLKYLAELIGRGQYKAKSTKMKKLNGEIQKEIGDRFNNKVYDWFKENSDFIIRKNIKISSFIKTKQDLGDIDVLLIDKQNKRIYSLECKYIYPARNAREMASELERLLDNSEGKSWTTKHLERHQTIEDNLPKLLKFLKIQKEYYKLYSTVLTSEEIPSVYLSKMPLTFINLMSLKRDGLKLLEKLDLVNGSS